LRQLKATLLLGQPFHYCLADDPTLASVDAFRDLVHAGNEILWKLRSDYAPVIRHLTNQSKKIKTNSIQYGEISDHPQ